MVKNKNKNSDFSTDLYKWNMKNPRDYLYVWKNGEFKIETKYKEIDNILSINIYSENKKLVDTEEYIIDDPIMNTIRRVTQRVLANEFNMW